MNNVYYVYLHRRASDNEIFYVGKGKGRRAYKNDRRSSLWNSIKDKHGLVIEIYKDNLSEKEALDIEMSLIKTIGRIDLGTGTLANFTDGGDTTNLSPTARQKISEKAKARVITDEQRRRRSEEKTGKFKSNPFVELINLDGSKISGKFSELLEFFGRPYYARLRNLIAGRTRSFDNWVINVGDDPILKLKEMRSSTKESIFTFVSIDAVVDMTRVEFELKYKIKSSPIFSSSDNNRRIIKGWAVVRDGETAEQVQELIKKIKTNRTYIFAHISGDEFIGTVKELSEYAGVKQSSLSGMFIKENPRPVKGWYIKERNDY
jgi:hypothetical protein